jgi:hypothetical protein
MPPIDRDGYRAARPAEAIHERVDVMSESNGRALERMYGDLASWWPLISPPAEYAGEAEAARRALLDACDPPPRMMLELGSGGGNNALHLKKHFSMTLVDRAPGMLAMSRMLNPECEHIEGDMRSIRLGREFDAVFVHDAIMYMTTEDDLRLAMRTAYVHCRPGGAALFEPDFVRETFEPQTDHGGEDGPDRSLRYLEWTWDPDATDSEVTVDYVYALREADGSIQTQHDRHICGLFSRATWLRLLRSVGFDPYTIADPWRADNFVARRPRP